MPKMIGRMASSKPAAKPAAKAAAKPGYAMDPASVLARAERVQRQEAGESAMVRRKAAQPVVKTTVSYRPTPTKKGK